MRILAKNQRAFYDYDILESFEAGIVLTGQETKSAKTNGAVITGGYARISNGEAHLLNAQIKPYKFASGLENYDAYQTRKLLLHKSEINRLVGKLSEKGLILVPLEMYVAHGKIKLKLGVGRSKKKLDKRETIRRREDDRVIQRAMKKRV